MPKKTLQEQNYAPKKPYTRAPIHYKVENEEDLIDDDEEEEDEVDYSNLHQRRNLYPDLSEDLRKSRETLKSKDSGRKGKKSEQSIMSENSDTSSHTSTLMYIISLLILLAVAIGGYFIYIPKKPSDKMNVADLITNMQNHFQMKTHDVTFKILNRALTKVVNEKPEPSAPAIFTVLANKGAEKTASDFSEYLAEALAPGSFLSINESLRWHNNADELKFEIDTKIRSKLDNGILNVIIVDRLNDIPIDAAMIFHSFCDHESAPFKRAVYLFIVHLNRRIPGNSSIKDIDTVAMDSLRNIWMTAKEDVVDSLITRITVNVISIV